MEEEIEKILLNDLEENIVMGWADGSEKSLLLELIRERRKYNETIGGFSADALKKAYIDGGWSGGDLDMFDIENYN